MDGLNEGGLFRMAGDECGTGVAAGLEVADIVHAQAALLLGVAVAVKAALHQDGPHFVFKELPG